MYRLIVFFSCLVLYPIMTLLHELGHASVLLLFTKQQAVILMGDPLEKKPGKEIKCGRLTIRMKGLKIYRGFSYLNEEYPLNSTVKLVLYFLGGSIVNLIILLLSFMIVYNIENKLGVAILNGTIYANLVQLTVLIPMTYSDGLQSDGKQVLNLLRYKR